jgi:TonB family protein
MSPSHLRCPSAVRRSTFQLLFVAALVALCGAASAQTPVAPAPAPGTELSASERAQRDADKVFQWIRIHSDKPRKASSANAAAAPAAPPTVKVAAKPTAKTDKGITESIQALGRPSARKDAGATHPSPAAPQPEPVATTVAAKTDTSAPIAPPISSPAIEEDAELSPIHRTEPDFPSSLMRQLRRGLVQVGFTVQPDGSVSQARAVSSTNPRLVATALATVTQWRFRPLRHAQQAIVDLGFNLED